jgi:predicted transcriptional regulator
MKKRERTEVIHDILRIVRDNQNSIKPTPLLRKSNLSSNNFADYYKELLEKEFVKEIMANKDRKYVTLTDKGFMFLEKYKIITGFIEEFDL